MSQRTIRSFDPRRRIGLIAAVFAIAATDLAQVHAGCGVRMTARQPAKAVVAQQQGGQQPPAVAIVPFAVPVAVPVATIAQPAVFYGYRQYTAQPTAIKDQSSAYRHDKLTADSFSADSYSIVARSCVVCHSGTAPKAGLDLTDLAQLTTEQRLSAVARVVSDDPTRRMPPTRPLPPAEIGRVLQELTEPGPGLSPRAANAGADR